MTGNFAQCQWPVWQVDDLSACFQNDYLRVLIPLIIVAVSLLQIISHNLRRAIKSRRSRRDGYHPVSDSHPNTAAEHTAVPPDEEIAEHEEDDALEINGGHLSLARTTTKGSIVQADVPPAARLSVTVEFLAIVGLVITSVLSLIYDAAGPSFRLGDIAAILTWSYVLALTSLRLFLGNTKWRVPRLWNHTATLYSIQWLLSLVFFRSAWIHPVSKLSQTLTFVEFVLISLLFGMAITTRKGNKTVVLEWEDGVEPSREPLASLFSLATFSWADPIIWKGYKTTTELNMVWNLLPKDKAGAVLAEYRAMKKTGSLVLHLLKFFRTDLFTQCLAAALGGVLTFGPTLLLKAILEYVEQPDNAPINVLWMYVILLPLVDVVRSIADGFALWIGRKICIRIRAIIIGEIYAKALRRKAATSKESVLGDTKEKSDEDKGGILAKAKRFLGLKKDGDKKNSDGADEADAGKNKGKDDDSSDEQANLGTIINLMSVDSFKIAEITAYMHFLCAAAPVQLTVCIVLLWQVMGRSSIPGLIVMVILLPVNYLFALGFTRTSKQILKATDKRINITNEVLQNIRIIKFFAWEARFSNIVDEKRAGEIKALRARYILWSCAVAVWNSVPILITFFTFLVYTLIEKKPLYPSVAFTAISLFMLLRIPLDQLGDMFAHVQETKVSIDRVDEFLSEEETEKYEQLGTDNVDEEGRKVIGFRDATFIWGGKDEVKEDGSQAFQLLDFNVDFEIGKLNIIAGPTGSGKSSLLMGLLGEMTLVKGRVFCPGGRSREDVRPDPETGLADTVAYAAQSPWLVNADIKENILFSAPYDEQRYKEVIIACALERDLEILDDGDETLVGEKGISLSGGQKQRISLARALYSNSQHVLLDDCLSAVDSHTAKWIFHNCIRGPLMKGRTCILVTHNVQLCAPSADLIVVLDNGRISAQGPAAEVIASGKLGEDVMKAKSASAEASQLPSRVPSSVGLESGATAVDSSNGGTSTDNAEAKKKKEKKKKNAMDEEKAVGSTKWPVMKLYLTAMGSWWFWVVTVGIFGVQQLSLVVTNFWVREWSNQYNVESSPGNTSHALYATQSLGLKAHEASSGFAASSPAYAAIASWAHKANSGTIMSMVAPEVNVAYYLTGLAAIGIVGAASAFMRDLWVFYGSLNASRKIHTRLMDSVTRAKFKFFDVTPLGQLMNRFSKDLEAVDQEVVPVAISLLFCALGIVITVIIISVITPLFLIGGVFITIIFWFVGALYLDVSRDLKRLESVQRSPLFQQFGETLSGMTTIRAYGDERRFIRENLVKINTQARPFIYLWACNRWLAFRCDMLGDLVAFFAGVLVIVTLGTVDAGAVGVSMSYAISFTESILWLVRLYAINEQNMNSVERIKEYLEVEQEAEAIVEKNRPAENWPAEGAVEFIKYTTSYRADLDPVLRDITFRVEPCQKVGIVGRTGAGKSSLALAIFRALEADAGQILIDGVDISKIGLQDLRQAITIVPQDPTLFQGTLRTNLDPFDTFTDEQIFTALRRVHLIGADEPSRPSTPSAATMLPPTPEIIGAETETESGEATPTSPTTNKNIFLDLSSAVTESGNNLSQGQRQLLCLARAMLRNPTVLVMDEATASIDYATDTKIQATIHELTSTIITIAHRLQTIVDYDRVLVLDKGRVVEFGHPYELLTKEKGDFKEMCEISGEYATLLKTAKKAWQGGQLVDVGDE
ncbi:probable YBT1 - Vacuolar, `full-size` ABC protein transporting bile acids [Cephalotrichum gorgonifer]|uniref:Probable YBT1 - Vacuolar, `full-size` ABC protein transporting bile acids n=1 Tax=Cephalotrichum gorgonifer TaxID=2041049 RepID=A0AAE8N630_9PEZI|nr:probable YBT1 - Vacuolar, `full-size` ABC protein transporting bile acids [Cephalotrichum gorgonifer]